LILELLVTVTQKVDQLLLLACYSRYLLAHIFLVLVGYGEGFDHIPLFSLQIEVSLVWCFGAHFVLVDDLRVLVHEWFSLRLLLFLLGHVLGV